MLATQKGRSKPVRISSNRWLKLISPPDASAAIVLEAGRETSKGVGGQAHRLDVESLDGLEVAVRLLLVAALLGLLFVGTTAGTGEKSAPELPDISRWGRDFLEVCSSVDSEGNKDAARIQRDATCLGWIQGFTDGFLVHEELLSVPRRDRMACVPRGVTTIQVVRVIKKYLADNPGKAHRPTRYIASIALAGVFPCRAGR